MQGLFCMNGFKMVYNFFCAMLLPLKIAEEWLNAEKLRDSSGYRPAAGWE